MRVAALYDIHGNLPALEAVLAEVRRAGVDQIVVGGDVVPGPMIRETLARLMALETPVAFIQGNCERELLQSAAGTGNFREQYQEILRWARQQLAPEMMQAIEKWPKTVRMRVEGIGEVLFCHATPRDDNEIFTRETPEARLSRIFEGLKVDLTVCGHTHAV